MLDPARVPHPECGAHSCGANTRRRFPITLFEQKEVDKEGECGCGVQGEVERERDARHGRGGGGGGGDGLAWDGLEDEGWEEEEEGPVDGADYYCELDTEWVWMKGKVVW